MNNLSKEILFVGDNALKHSQIRAELAGMNPDWKAAFSAAAQEALALLGQTRFDAVVADDCLPDMDGFNFLNTVQQQFPESRRVIVCDLGDSKVALKGTRIAHQCVPKPWDTETIRETLDRAFGLGIWLSNSVVRGLVQRMTIVPSPPDLYFEIARALRSNEVDLEDISRRAAQDPALTAKLLQVANSAALGLRHKVTNVQDAIGYLGLETTRSLVLLAHTFAYCDRVRLAGFSMERLWQHSLTTGTLARKIARDEKARPELVDESFLAGLLHDIGELLLAVNMPEEYHSVLGRVRQSVPPNSFPKPGISLSQAELDQFGSTHAEIGAELMAMWNLPMSVVEALALHHQPTKLLSSSFCPLVAVHVADAFTCDFFGATDPVGYTEIDLTYLWDVGFAERLELWREACREELQRGDETDRW